MEEKIIDKIKKLLKKAESAKEIGSLAEAEAFMNKANELLIEYNLTMHQIAMSSMKDADIFAKWLYSEPITYDETLAGKRWKLELIGVICTYNLCWYTYNSSSKTFRVYGDMQNVESVIWIYNFLHIRLLHMAKESRKANKDQSDLLCRHTYLKNYLKGAIDGINVKLYLQQQAAKKGTPGVSDLILYNDKALDQYRKEKLPKLYKDSTRKMEPGLGYENGYDDAKNIDLNKKLQSEVIIEKKLLN